MASMAAFRAANVMEGEVATSNSRPACLKAREEQAEGPGSASMVVVVGG